MGWSCIHIKRESVQGVKSRFCSCEVTIPGQTLVSHSLRVEISTASYIGTRLPHALSWVIARHLDEAIFWWNCSEHVWDGWPTEEAASNFAIYLSPKT
jgi:hypothetical protein